MYTHVFANIESDVLCEVFGDSAYASAGVPSYSSSDPLSHSGT